MDTWEWVILCFGVGAIGAFVGYLFGAGITAQHWQNVVATREEAFRNHWNRPIRWYWWTGRDETRNDRNEWLVGAVGDTERDAKMKLDPAKIPLLDKARAKGVKEVGLHVLTAYSREDIHVQTI